MLVGAVTIAGMLLLAGCGGGDPIPTLPPTPSATPIFASEEEALAAAEDAYAAYRGMSDQISAEGGANPERIAPFVTESRLADELRGFATFALKKTAARRMRNPATRNPANIAKRKAAKLPPAKEFIDVPARESAVAKASPRFLSGKRSGAV